MRLCNLHHVGSRAPHPIAPRASGGLGTALIHDIPNPDAVIYAGHVHPHAPRATNLHTSPRLAYATGANNVENVSSRKDEVLAAGADVSKVDPRSSKIATELYPNSALRLISLVQVPAGFWLCNFYASTP